MIHWENDPNDIGQSFLIGGAFNSQMNMGGVVVVVTPTPKGVVYKARRFQRERPSGLFKQAMRRSGRIPRK